MEGSKITENALEIGFVKSTNLMLIYETRKVNGGFWSVSAKMDFYCAVKYDSRLGDRVRNPHHQDLQARLCLDETAVDIK